MLLFNSLSMGWGVEGTSPGSALKQHGLAFIMVLIAKNWVHWHGLCIVAQ